MKCRPCFHPQRNEIDKQIVDGVPYRIISATFDLSLGALSRHREHVKQALATAVGTRECERTEHGSDLFLRVQRLVGECEQILADARSEKDLKAAVSAIAAATRLLELIGRLSGELQSPNAGGIHLTLNQRTTTTTINVGDDNELAGLLFEATNGFDPTTIEHFRLLAASGLQPDVPLKVTDNQ